MIELKNLSKSYNGGVTFAVNGISFSVPEGEFLVLLGESGCGKTTTLKMINRLVEPSSGEIRMGGRNVAKIDPVLLRRRIGYVFQDIGLFPHMTVEENISTVPKLLEWQSKDIKERVNELLELVSLPADKYTERMPDNLSGGEKQRVGLARALAGKPKIMLMDEPFGALDPLTRDSLQNEYRAIHDELHLTTVMVTHDMIEALLLADRIAAMHNGEIVQVGTPYELISSPVDDYVRRLMETPRKQADRLNELERQKSQV